LRDAWCAVGVLLERNKNRRRKCFFGGGGGGGGGVMMKKRRRGYDNGRCRWRRRV